MRKLILVISILTFFSCSDKKEEVPETTYQIINNMEMEERPSIEYLDGTLWEVTVFCLDETGDVVREDNLDPIEPNGGKSDIVKVPDYVDKIVVSFKFLPRESAFYDMDENNRKYTVTRYVITPMQNNEIDISGKTNIKETMSIYGNLEVTINSFVNGF